MQERNVVILLEQGHPFRNTKDVDIGPLCRAFDYIINKVNTECAT
jgi:hypothetical protein